MIWNKKWVKVRVLFLGEFGVSLACTQTPISRDAKICLLFYTHRPEDCTFDYMLKGNDYLLYMPHHIGRQIRVM